MTITALPESGPRVQAQPPVDGHRPAPAVVALVARSPNVSSGARAAFAHRLEEASGGPGLLVLRTCQRVEVYASGPAFDGGLDLPPAPTGVELLVDADAARHLISVACGLDSIVLGEDQVLHQVREAYAVRRAGGPLDPALDRLVQVALRAGRRAHGWFGDDRPSLADVALAHVDRVIGPIEGRTLLVVGSGAMGSLAATAAARRGARVRVTSRTDAHARRVARRVGGIVVPWAGDDALDGVDAVVTAVSGRWRPGGRDVRALVESAIPWVDLSSPSCVDPDLRHRLGERLVGVDDLAWGADASLPAPLRERLERLVSDAGAEYCRWVRQRDRQPAIRELSEAVESRCQAEVDWLLRRLPDLTERDRALVHQMSHRVAAAILHAPRTALRVDPSGDLDRAARELFAL